MYNPVSRTIPAAALLVFGVLHLPAQTFSPLIEPPFTIKRNQRLLNFLGYTSDYFRRVFAVADFNKDGLPDVVGAYVNSRYELSVGVGLNDGQGNCDGKAGGGGATHVTVFRGPAWSVGTGDINGDGHRDFIVANGFNTVGASVYLGDGRGGVVRLPEYVLATQIVKLADLNGDGKDDLIAHTLPDRATGVWVNLSDGTGKFDVLKRMKVHDWFTDIKVLDFDGDGIKDILGHAGTGPIDFWKGDGKGGFAYNATLVGNGPPSFEVVDLNGDGKLDIVRGGDGIAIWLADETTKFSPAPGSPFRTAGGGTYDSVLLGTSTQTARQTS